MEINASGNDKLLLKYAMKNDKKEEIFHSSGYARAQAGQNFGAAGGSDESFSARKTLDTDRKYIQGYKNSRISNEYRSMQRAKSIADSAVSSINGGTASGYRGGSTGGDNAGAANSMGAANPMNAATARAKQAASTPRAPQIPMRRSGI